MKPNTKRRSFFRRTGAGALVFALLVIGACSQSTGSNNGVPTYSVPYFIFLINAALAGTGRFQPRVKAQAPAAGSYVLGSSTPFLPFAGNRLVVADPVSVDRTSVASAILQRASNCSLTETVFQRVNGQLDASASLDLPNAQDYLHQVSGLTTQADVFPNGCVDSPRGKRAVNTALPLAVTASSIRFADLNPNTEQLEVRTADRTTGALTAIALTPGRVRYFLVVDMNGDGLPDIVASGVGYGVGNNGNVVVFLNNGNGTFRTAATVASNGANFTVDDLNGDGKPDLVIDNGSDSTGTPIPGVSTLLGNGDGTFAAAIVSATGISGAGGPFITGDFNGDGKPDLLLGGQVLLGRGDGTFTVGPSLPVVAQNEIGVNAAVGDLNRDGKVDIAYTGTGGGFVQVLLGNGDGSFTLGARYASLSPLQGIAITEIDGDGNLDLFVGNASQGIFTGTVDDPLVERFQVLLGRGDGTFVGAPVFGGVYGSNSSAAQLATADFDGDGRLDALAVDNSTSNGLVMMPGDGRGAFGTSVRSPTLVQASMVATADFNGDGKPDVVAAGTSASALPIVAVLLNQGGGRFAAERDYALPNYPTAIAVGDFDGDGRMDVAVALGTSAYTSPGQNGVYVLYGQSDGTLAAPVLIDPSKAAISLAVADLNGDGRSDLAIADSGAANGTGALRVYLGRADRTFAATTIPTTTATRFTAVAIADIDGDGKPDVIAAGAVPTASFGVIVPNVYTYIGNGDGTLKVPQTAVLAGADGTGANAIAIGDFNHDGHLDLAVGNQADYTEIFLGNGDGTYVHGLLTLGQGPNTIVAADLDNDQYADLLIGTAGIGTAVYKNAGTVAAWVLPSATSGTTTTPVAPSPAGDFTLTATPSSGSIVAGQSVTTTVAAMPTSDFNQTITLACSAGLPANATCSFTPSSLTPTGGAAASSSLTITTRAATALGFIAPGRGMGGGVWIATLGAGALLNRRRRSRWQAAAPLLLMALLASCGGGDNGTSGTETTATTVAATGTTYNVTITATAGSTSHATTYALVVH